jgi:hypothetical protein
MLNILVLAAFLFWGWHLRLPAGFFVLVGVGTVAAVGSGFASFSRGKLFRPPRGDMYSALLALVFAGCSVAIGWNYRPMLGFVSFAVFWPVMYRVGVHIFRWGTRPIDSKRDAEIRKRLNIPVDTPRRSQHSFSDPARARQYEHYLANGGTLPPALWFGQESDLLDFPTAGENQN